MKMLSINQLEKQLNYNQGMTFFIKLDGMITTNIEIKNVGTKFDKNNLIIFDKKDKSNIVLLNKHQIMKIEQFFKEIYYIRFDFIQNVKIIVDK